MASPKPVKRDGEKTADYRARVAAWKLKEETASKVASEQKGKPVKKEGEKTADYRARVEAWKSSQPASSPTPTITGPTASGGTGPIAPGAQPSASKPIVTPKPTPTPAPPPAAPSKAAGQAKPTKQEGEKTAAYRDRVQTWKSTPAPAPTPTNPPSKVGGDAKPVKEAKEKTAAYRERVQTWKDTPATAPTPTNTPSKASGAIKPVKQEGEKTSAYRDRVQTWRDAPAAPSKAAGDPKPVKQEGEKTSAYRDRVGTWKSTMGQAVEDRRSKYELGNKGKMTSKTIADMRQQGLSDRQIKRQVRNFAKDGGELGERATEFARRGRDEVSAGNRLTGKDLRDMKAQGFSKDKIQETIQNHQGKVGKKVAGWLGRQAEKNQNGGTDPGSGGGNQSGGDQITTGDDSPVTTGDNSPITTGENSPITTGNDNIITPGDNNNIGEDITDVSGNDNVVGEDNQVVTDSGDITQDTNIENSQSMDNWTMDNDNQVNQGDNSFNYQQIDNSVRQYGGDNRSFVWNSANTGVSDGSMGGLDGAATAATLGGFYDVDDSPAAQAKFVDMHNTINIDQQKRFSNADPYAQMAIEQAARNTTIDPNKMDQRIHAREQAAMASARLGYNNLFGDPSKPVADWVRPETPKPNEEPDWDNMYDNMTNYG